MPFADVNGFEPCYETAGNPSHRPILLIAWPGAARGAGVRAIADLVATAEHA